MRYSQFTFSALRKRNPFFALCHVHSLWNSPRAVMAFPWANGPKGSFAERMVSLWTSGSPNNVGHADMWYLIDNKIWRGTSTTDRGVIFDTHDGNGQPLKWDDQAYLYLPMPEDFPVERAIDRQMKIVGAPYDTKAVPWRFVLPPWMASQNPSAWYCSEDVAYQAAVDDRFVSAMMARECQYSPYALVNATVDILAEIHQHKNGTKALYACRAALQQGVAA